MALWSVNLRDLSSPVVDLNREMMKEANQYWGLVSLDKKEHHELSKVRTKVFCRERARFLVNLLASPVEPRDANRLSPPHLTVSD